MMAISRRTGMMGGGAAALAASFGKKSKAFAARSHSSPWVASTSAFRQRSKRF
jgi:hypothetical protein